MLYGYLPAILEGLRSTLVVSAVSLAIACLFGLVGAAAKLSPSRAANLAADAYTTLIRGLPELVLMLFVFYGGQYALNAVAEWAGAARPPEVPPFAAGVLTIGFVYGAYLAETFRGAILAIPRGQIEAGLAFGMTRLQVLRRITLPQMVRHAIPGFTNNWLVMIKATAIVSVIGLSDLMNRAAQAAGSTREPFLFYGAAALLYLAFTTLSELGFAWLGRRLAIGTRKAAL